MEVGDRDGFEDLRLVVVVVVVKGGGVGG